jgi:outer membrane protein assembly factor BamB
MSFAAAEQNMSPVDGARSSIARTLLAFVGVFIALTVVACVAGCGGHDKVSVAALDTRTGKQLWRTTLNADSLTGPTVFGSMVVVYTANRAKTHCGPGETRRIALDTLTGRVLDHPQIPPSATDSNREIPGAITIQSESGRVEAVDAHGRQIWSYSVPGKGSYDVAVVEGRVFVPFEGTNPYGNCGD